MKAMTIPEVLFACAIMSMVCVGTLLIFVQTVEISKKVNYKYNAIQLARNRLERARSVVDAGGFSSLSDLGETDSVLDSDGGSDPNGNFKRSTTITTSYSGVARLTKVEVTITYKYQETWKTNAAVTVTTIFGNIA